MNFSRLFVMRPIATTLLAISLMLCGVLAYRLLPISSLPQVDYPTFRVVTTWPGANPDTILKGVTAPLERQLGQIPGLMQMSSSSGLGQSVIVLRFLLDMSSNQVELDVQAAINAATNVLPKDLVAPPVYQKVNPADAPILVWAVQSNQIPLARLQEMVDQRLLPKISQVPGVGLVSISGGGRPAYRLQVNAQALASNQLTLEDIRHVIEKANINMPKGSLDGSSRLTLIDANDLLVTEDDFRNLILRANGEKVLKLGDVADISMGSENNQQAAWVNNEPGLLIQIRRQPEANVVAVIDQLNLLLPELQRLLPAHAQITPIADRTLNIRAAIESVQFELVLAMALVVMVTFLFLRRVRLTLIPSITIPISILGTFAAMYLLDYSINSLTLMALTVATGFVVDDAIVMLENINRRQELGENPIDAAINGAMQITPTLISLSISLIAVLIPLLFMQSLIGLVFREFAITLAIAILVSLLVSLTLTPMMASRIQHQEQPPVNHWFNWLQGHYQKLLDWSLRHQTWVLLMTLTAMLATLLLYSWMPKGFFPTQDTGLITGVSLIADNGSFSSMAAKQSTIVTQLMRDPDIAHVSSAAGVDSNNLTMNTGPIDITLQPHDKRDDSEKILERIQTYAATIAGIHLIMQPIQDLTVEDTASLAQYQIRLSADNTHDLAKWTQAINQWLSQSALFEDVIDTFFDHGQSVHLEIDRSSAALLGVTTNDILNVLYDAFGQRQISTVFTQSNQFQVVLSASGTQQSPHAFLNGLYVQGLIEGKPSLIPINQLVRIQTQVSSTWLTRSNQFPSVSIAFNLKKGVDLDKALEFIAQARNQLSIPKNIQLETVGLTSAFEESLSNTFWLMMAAIVTMYIVLGILYESFIHPITVLSTLPSAIIGALMALIVFQKPLDMIAVMGLILLIGIVKKNAIMMIDFAIAAQKESKKTPQEAIREAALIRFRPILMTTLAALLGALPLMLAGGAGSELRQPLGIAIVGGLIVSQVLTLMSTPVIYLCFHRWLNKEADQPPPTAYNVQNLE